VIRYLAIATACLFLGIALNAALRGNLGDDLDPVFSLFVLVVLWCMLHIISVSAASVTAIFFRGRVLSLVYVISSVSGFLASIFFFYRTGGVHLFIIFCGSLVLISVDYFRRFQRSVSRGQP